MSVKSVFSKKDLNLHTYKLFQEQKYKKYKLNDWSTTFKYKVRVRKYWARVSKKYAGVIKAFLGKEFYIVCIENMSAAYCLFPLLCYSFLLLYSLYPKEKKSLYCNYVFNYTFDIILLNLAKWLCFLMLTKTFLQLWLSGWNIPW